MATFKVVLYHKNFPTFNFLVIQSIPLVYIKIKKLERWMRNKGGLNSWENSIKYNQEGSLLELNCNFKVTIPINLSSAISASHHPYRWALRSCILNDYFCDLWYEILLKIPWIFLSQGLWICSFQCQKFPLSSFFSLLS